MKLEITNGKVHEADQVCEGCDTAGLLPNFNYCPFCGEDL